MNGPEHYAEAERQLAALQDPDRSRSRQPGDPPRPAWSWLDNQTLASVAALHVSLAGVAAQAAAFLNYMPEERYQAWVAVTK